MQQFDLLPRTSIRVSAGRAQVSKSSGRRFDTAHPCQQTGYLAMSGVRILPSAPTDLRVGQPGNPPELESGDRWIEASRADQL